MLREGVDIMHQAWTTGQATLDGKYSQVDGALVHPQPLQDEGIPFWIAGGGEKVTLKVAAKYASYTNFAGSIEEFDHKRSVLHEHCAALGRDPGEITQSSNVNTIVGATEAEADERLAAIEADYRGSLGFGTPEQIVERLTERVDHGLGYAIHYFPEAAYDSSGIELFEREVIPALA